MKTSTLLLLAGAGLLAAHRLAPATPVSGLGSLRKKFKKATRKFGGGLKQSLATVKKAGRTVASIQQKYDPGTKLIMGAAKQATKIAPKPLRKVVGRISIAGKRVVQRPSPAAPGEPVEYQDENGNVITQAQYEAIQACWSGGGTWANGACQRTYSGAPAPSPQPSQDWSQYIPPQPSSGGGGGGSGEPSLLPAAASTPVPSTADAAEPKKSNPLLAIAAFVAVPVVMGLTGEK